MPDTVIFLPVGRISFPEILLAQGAALWLAAGQYHNSQGCNYCYIDIPKPHCFTPLCADSSAARI